MIEQLLEETLGGLVPETVIAILVGAILVILALSIVMYVYGALTAMFTARKLKTEPAWLAWIPIVGVPLLMSKMAKMEWWPVLLLAGMFIPFIGWAAQMAFIVFVYIWWWKITELRGLPGWITLLTLFPVLGWLWGLVLWGILAWGK